MGCFWGNFSSKCLKWCYSILFLLCAESNHTTTQCGGLTLSSKPMKMSIFKNNSKSLCLTLMTPEPHVELVPLFCRPEGESDYSNFDAIILQTKLAKSTYLDTFHHCTQVKQFKVTYKHFPLHRSIKRDYSQICCCICSSAPRQSPRVLKAAGCFLEEEEEEDEGSDPGVRLLLLHPRHSAREVDKCDSRQISEESNNEGSFSGIFL